MDVRFKLDDLFKKYKSIPTVKRYDTINEVIASLDGAMQRRKEAELLLEKEDEAIENETEGVDSVTVSSDDDSDANNDEEEEDDDESDDDGDDDDDDDDDDDQEEADEDSAADVDDSEDDDDESDESDEEDEVLLDKELSRVSSSSEDPYRKQRRLDSKWNENSRRIWIANSKRSCLSHMDQRSSCNCCNCRTYWASHQLSSNRYHFLVNSTFPKDPHLGLINKVQWLLDC